VVRATLSRLAFYGSTLCNIVQVAEYENVIQSGCLRAASDCFHRVDNILGARKKDRSSSIQEHVATPSSATTRHPSEECPLVGYVARPMAHGMIDTSYVVLHGLVVRHQKQTRRGGVVFRVTYLRKSIGRSHVVCC
jgi:hypothetical protein